MRIGTSGVRWECGELRGEEWDKWSKVGVWRVEG